MKHQFFGKLKTFVLNKKQLPLLLLAAGIIVFGGVTINQLYLNRGIDVSNERAKQSTVAGESTIDNYEGEVAGSQSDDDSTASPTLAPTTTKQTTPTNTPEVKSQTGEQNNTSSNSQNNGNTTTIIVTTPTPAPTSTLTPHPSSTSNPVYVSEKDCTVYYEHLSYLEESKQSAIDQARTNGENECAARGYPPPDYIGCEGYIQARIDEVTPDYDYQISLWKLQADPYGECD